MAGNDDLIARLRDAGHIVKKTISTQGKSSDVTAYWAAVACFSGAGALAERDATIERLTVAWGDSQLAACSALNLATAAERERDVIKETLDKAVVRYLRAEQDFLDDAADLRRERDEARAEVERLMRVFRVPGCALFLDVRSVLVPHVIMSYPTNIPENVEDDISEFAEEVLSAAEALGFVVGEDHVWTEWRWVEPQIGDEGRVELRGYWEFVRIDEGLSRAALQQSEVKP